MEQVNKYYFELTIEFQNDYKVSNLEKLLNLKAYELIELKDSVGPVKTAKFFYRTGELKDIYSDEAFEEFINELKPHLISLLPILKSERGHINFCIVFTGLNDKPIIGLSSETIKTLAELNASYEVDFT